MISIPLDPLGTDIVEACDWANDVIGAGRYRITVPWPNNKWMFFEFYTEADASTFALKWTQQ